MPPNTESSVQRSILNWLGSRTWCRAWRSNTGVFRTLDGQRIVSTNVPGAADISGVLAPHGRRLEVEVKSKRGSQSKQQRAYQRAIEAMGGVYIVARSLNDTKQQLRRAGYHDGRDAA